MGLIGSLEEPPGTHLEPFEAFRSSFGAYFLPLGASGSLFFLFGFHFPALGTFWELIFKLPGASWNLVSSSRSFQELLGAYIQTPGASGSLYSTCRSFWELAFNLQELPGAYIFNLRELPGAYIFNLWELP